VSSSASKLGEALSKPDNKEGPRQVKCRVSGRLEEIRRRLWPQNCIGMRLLDFVVGFVGLGLRGKGLQSRDALPHLEKSPQTTVTRVTVVTPLREPDREDLFSVTINGASR
jgi:hypothetical protein